MANTTVSKNKQGYGYKYTDLSQIHEFLESINMKYYQYIENYEGNDYIYTVPIQIMPDGTEKEFPPRRGCRIVQAVLSGKSNPAQENGSAITYARRYSLLMAFGLATDDDDAQSMISNKQANKPVNNAKQQQTEQPKQTQVNKTQTAQEKTEDARTDEQKNAEMVNSTDMDLVPHGEGMTPKRLARLRKAQEICKKNDKTILATAKADSFEEITEANYISIMNLFLRLMTPEQKKEIEAI